MNFQKVKYFVYQKSLIQTLHTSFLTRKYFFEFTARDHKFKRLFCTQQSVLNKCFKDFWYTKKISGMTNSINNYLRIQINSTHNTIFLP